MSVQRIDSFQKQSEKSISTENNRYDFLQEALQEGRLLYWINEKNKNINTKWKISQIYSTAKNTIARIRLESDDSKFKQDAGVTDIAFCLPEGREMNDALDNITRISLLRFNCVEKFIKNFPGFEIQAEKMRFMKNGFTNSALEFACPLDLAQQYLSSGNFQHESAWGSLAESQPSGLSSPSSLDLTFDQMGASLNQASGGDVQGDSNALLAPNFSHIHDSQPVMAVVVENQPDVTIDNSKIVSRASRKRSCKSVSSQKKDTGQIQKTSRKIKKLSPNAVNKSSICKNKKHNSPTLEKIRAKIKEMFPGRGQSRYKPEIQYNGINKHLSLRIHDSSINKYIQSTSRRELDMDENDKLRFDKVEKIFKKNKERILREMK